MVYRVIEPNEHVEILAVVHGAREIKGILRQEWEL
ncbi:MAG TPA: hypothetical protein ENN23_08820 [Deltaproteobacteria bacterium]|nr:hypothetical protein [Deltaproteobacteria bacterium]